MTEAAFSILVGKTLAKITGLEKGSDAVIFTTEDGERFRMYHWQDCCESVSIEDVAGDVEDLIGERVAFAEESTSTENPVGVDVSDLYQDSFTWTFYRIGTNKGTVVIRWYGESNGYYSESVSFEKVA
jgi:hypothetical protein